MNKDLIYEVLSEVTGNSRQALAQMPENQKLSDIGLDSIKFIQLIVALEDRFSIEINDSDLIFENFETLHKLYCTLDKYLKHATPKKVLVCDCDNVLWHGVAGEEQIYLDENTLQLHQILIKLYNHGVYLCLCSKNDQAAVDRAFQCLKMELRPEHIAIKQINWNDKATNLRKIAKQLNVSLDSFVFLDDSDYELGLVSSLIPEIVTVKAEYNDCAFMQAIQDLFLDDAPSLNRTELYKQQKEREKEKLRFSTVAEYNRSLNTILTFEFATAQSAKRIAELTQRTNQFNLSNRRYTEQQILNLIDEKNNQILTLSVRDQFGDMGLVGAMIYEMKENAVIIHSFYLSCRVLGRDFEQLMLEQIKKIGQPVYGVYRQTEKNKKHQSFYAENEVKLYEV